MQVTIINPGGDACIGVGDKAYATTGSRSHSVGRDGHSWGLAVSDGVAQATHDGSGKPWGAAWSAGDVIGVLVSSQRGCGLALSFTLNGELMDTTNAFEGIEPEAVSCRGLYSCARGWCGIPLTTASAQGLCPAVSFCHPFSFRINFGERPFTQVVPQGFRSVRTWYQRESEYTFAKHASSRGRMGALLPTGHDTGAIIDGTLVSSTAAGATVGGAGILLTRGKWYWEVRVSSDGTGSIGWCDLEHLRNAATATVGDSRHSWAFDGGRRLFLGNGRAVPWGRHWHAGDVVGIAADLDNRKLQWSLNGSWEAPMGSAVHLTAFQGGLVPVLVASPGFACTVNWGGSGFAHHPPTPAYRSIQDWIVRHARGGIVAQFDPYVMFAFTCGVCGSRGTCLLIGWLTVLRCCRRSLSLPSGVSMAAQDAAGVTLRADSGHGMVVVSGGNRVRALDGLPTVVAHPVRLARGQWYYEVHVLRAGEACIGWTDKAFFGDWATHCGVGDDKHSWGFQGSRTGGKAKTGGRAQSAGGCWAQGSVVGVAIDVDARTMSFSLDGSTDDTWGVMFTGMEFDTCVFVAASCDAMRRASLC